MKELYTEIWNYADGLIFGIIADLDLDNAFGYVVALTSEIEDEVDDQ